MTSLAFTMHRSWRRQPTIGFLGATSPAIWNAFVTAFDDKLRDLGWIDGSNIIVDYRWAQGRTDLYSKITKEFVDRGVDIIVTSGTPAVRAAKKVTSKTPIVFASAGHPVHSKLIASHKRPGGNVTGMSNGQADLGARRVDELRKVLPGLKRLALIGNYSNHAVALEMIEIQKRARRRKISTVVCDIRQASQIGPAIKRLRGKVDALYICTDPVMTTHHVAINTAAAAARLPTMHAFRDYVEAGGLMSYGPDFRAMFGNAAVLVDKILRGADPADIPVKVQKKRELVINQNTAHALGVPIPKGVRKRATMVR